MHVHNGVIIVMEKLMASSPTILERKKKNFFLIEIISILLCWSSQDY